MKIRQDRGVHSVEEPVNGTMSLLAFDGFFKDPGT
jgi:hypothetical protein